MSIAHASPNEIVRTSLNTANLSRRSRLGSVFIAYPTLKLGLVSASLDGAYFTLNLHSVGGASSSNVGSSLASGEIANIRLNLRAVSLTQSSLFRGVRAAFDTTSLDYGAVSRTHSAIDTEAVASRSAALFNLGTVESTYASLNAKVRASCDATRFLGLDGAM